MKLKKYSRLIIISLILTSCYFLDYKSEIIKSPSGSFEIYTTVNRTNKNQDDYAYVVVHLFDNIGKLKTFNTKAGDANKWAIGWT